MYCHKEILYGVPWWPSGWGFSVITAVAQVQSLARELLHAAGKAKKKKKRNSIILYVVVYYLGPASKEETLE